MKVIDLLNKIANNEEVPKKIKYMGYCYSWCESCEIHEATDEKCGRFNLYDFIAKEGNLNDKIEIIEEKPKKIEKLKETANISPIGNTKELIMAYELIHKTEDKINEIIDYLLEKESDK